MRDRSLLPVRDQLVVSIELARQVTRVDKVDRRAAWHYQTV